MSKFSNETKFQIEPKCQAILDKAREKQSKAVRNQEIHHEAEVRRKRANNAWLRVYHFKVEGTQGLSDDALNTIYARLLVDLGQVLRKDGWEKRLDAVTLDSDAKTYAVEILRKAIKGNLNAVTQMIQAMVDTLSELGFQADDWLRNGLRYEVLGIQPPPEKPIGWIGPYPESVETVQDFKKWIYDEIQYTHLFGRGKAGRLVHNAYILVDKLKLTGMPPEPCGPFTIDHEIAFLRNLGRHCTQTDEKRTLPAAVSPLSAKDLATIVGKPVPAVESFLRRYRDKYPDCYMSTEAPRRNEPRYLYRVSDVL